MEDREDKKSDTVELPKWLIVSVSGLFSALVLATIPVSIQAYVQLQVVGERMSALNSQLTKLEDSVAQINGRSAERYTVAQHNNYANKVESDMRDLRQKVDSEVRDLNRKIQELQGRVPK